jgi:hypothetical protein
LKPLLLKCLDCHIEFIIDYPPTHDKDLWTSFSKFEELVGLVAVLLLAVLDRRWSPSRSSCADDEGEQALRTHTADSRGSNITGACRRNGKSRIRVESS